jgi:transketolase
MVQALTAADRLAEQGIDVRVLNIHTIKPLDTEAVLQAARETGLIVTAEEHQVTGGLGSAVAEVVSALPVPVIRVGVKDTFGESGTCSFSYSKYGLTADVLVEKILSARPNP